MAEADPITRREMLDFRQDESAWLSSNDRLSLDGLTLSDCVLEPNPGMPVGARQFTVAVHDGEPFTMDWTPPGSDRLESRIIRPGEVHIHRGEEPFFQRWEGRQRLIVFALESDFMEQVADEAFGVRNMNLRTLIGVDDSDIATAARFWRREIRESGAGSRLLAESLGTLLTVYLCRKYGDPAARFRVARGGLPEYRLRRVLDYIEAHLPDNLGLRDLAAVAGLSTHHFADMFRLTTGQTPHRYVMERRIKRAQRLLRNPDLPIAQVALEVGFANQSHFTVNFRKVTGVTPRRFRLEAI